MNIADNQAFIFSMIIWAVALFVIIFIWRNANGRDFETRRLYFAAGTLTGLGLLFALSMGMYYWETPSPTPNGSSAGKEIFEACLNVVPPIVTFILGYYFGASQRSHNKGEMDRSETQINEPTNSETSN